MQRRQKILEETSLKSTMLQKHSDPAPAPGGAIVFLRGRPVTTIIDYRGNEMDSPPEGWEQNTFEHDRTRHVVYRRGDGPGVIVLHELPGLAPRSLYLGQRLSQQGYSIYMPLLFGRCGQDSSLRGVVQMCMSREFTLLRLGRTSPITSRLRGLARSVNQGTGNYGVVAIGMCATGGLVLGMVVEDGMRGVVASQPSLPLALPMVSSARRKGDVGLGATDLNAVIQSARDHGKRVLTLRFKRDVICPAERAWAIASSFPDSVSIQIPPNGDYRAASPPIRRLAHSTLVYDFNEDPSHPAHEGWLALIAFLRASLPTPTATAE